MSEPLANLNGRILPLSQVLIPATDRGFLFGDAVYEVLRVYRGQPFLEQEHFDRLEASLRSIRVAGVNLGRLRQRMRETLEASGFAEALIYLQITRGSAPRSHVFPEQATPLELLWVQSFSDPYGPLRQQGGKALLQPDIRWGRCDIKSTNLLANVLAAQAAREAGCFEAVLYLPDGRLTEASHSSLFGVDALGKLWTTPNNPDILPGITRAVILQLARELQIPVHEEMMHRDQLNQLTELFITGTSAEVLPIIEISGQTIGSGQPGPITRQLQQAHDRFVEQSLSR